MSIVLTAFMLSFLAGISTMIGAFVAFFIKKPSAKVLSLILGFSAGVMIGISFIELLPTSMAEIGFVSSNFAFIGGMVLMFVIDIAIPHEYITEKAASNDPKLMKAGLLAAVGLAIHNFPEGIATLTGAFHSLEVGLLLAFAIAFHNIPEGMSVSIPIFCATGDKKKAFLYSSAAGLFEPVGAVIGLFFLLPFLSGPLINYVLAAVAGIMVFISFDELLPAAHHYGEEHTAAFGVILGFIVMVLSLFWLEM